MKRIVIVILTLVFGFELFAQQIRVDRLENDGARQIMTSSKDILLSGNEYSFYLKCYFYDNHEDWCLGIGSFYFIPEKAKLLIKMGNGQVIDMTCNNVNVGTVTAYNVISKYYSSIFEIPSGFFELLDSFGIDKIRLSTRTGFVERSFYTNKLGRFLLRARDKIVHQQKNYFIRKKRYLRGFLIRFFSYEY